MDIDTFLAQARHIAGNDAVVGKDSKGWVILLNAGSGKSIKGRGDTPELALQNLCTCPGHPHDNWCNVWKWVRP